MNGARALRLVLQAGSGRVLDCGQVATAIAAEPDQAGPLLFGTNTLNAAVLIKDFIPGSRKHAQAGSQARRHVGTKIYLPFDSADIFAGGRTIFFGGSQFHRALGDLIDLSVTETRDAFHQDCERLQLIHSLPSLAPFLLRDRLQREKIEVDLRYFNLPEDEWQRISAFIRTQFQRIIQALFPTEQANAAARLERLLDRLWNLNDLPALEELADAFRLPRENCVETFYAWKGVLYFTYEYAALGDRMRGFLTWLRDTQTRVEDMPQRDTRDQIAPVLHTLRKRTAATVSDITQRLEQYERAFDELFTQQRGPAAFLQFLLDAPSHFEALGLTIARLQHTIDVWDRQSERHPNRTVPVETLMELLPILAEVADEQLDTH